MNEKKIYRRFINSDSDELWIKYDGQDFYELFNEVMPFKAYLKYFENKKFKTVNFRKLISTLPQHDVEEQEHIVVERFKSWKGNTDQIDDVLVVGIKLV